MIRRLPLRSIALLLFVIALGYVWQLLSSEPSRRAFLNATVLTMDSNNHVAQAVLVDDGRIVAVGSNEDIRALADQHTQLRNLGGRVLMPGIIDAHGHFPGSGIVEVAADLNSPPIGSITSIADLKTALRSESEEKSSGDWVFGFGYDDTLLQEKRHPNRYDLDQVSNDRPIFIMHVSGHMGVANSRALELAGITAASVNPEGGVIVKDPDTHQPTGLLEESAANRVQAMAVDFGIMDLLKLTRYASQEYLEQGVTTAQSGGVDPSMYSGLRWASLLELAAPRLVVFPLYDSLGEKRLSAPEFFDGHHTEKFLLGPVKIIADGSIQGFTGYLSKPYHTPFRGDSAYTGYPRIAAKELTAVVAKFHRAGIPLAIHGNGDASIDDIIAAFEAAQAQFPNTDPRLILIHSQMVRADQLDRFNELGITPSFFSAHSYYWGDRHSELFMGPERAANMSPAQWALEKQVPFSIHLDTPVVPMQPFVLVWSAVNRVSSEGKIIGPAQRISALQALRAVTIDAAWQIRQEANLGSIEPGKLADLIVLSDDPLINPAAIRDIKVVETIISGQTVYTR